MAQKVWRSDAPNNDIEVREIIRPPISSFNQNILSGYIVQRSPTADLETWGRSLHRLWTIWCWAQGLPTRLCWGPFISSLNGTHNTLTPHPRTEQFVKRYCQKQNTDVTIRTKVQWHRPDTQIQTIPEQLEYCSWLAPWIEYTITAIHPTKVSTLLLFEIVADHQICSQSIGLFTLKLRPGWRRCASTLNWAGRLKQRGLGGRMLLLMLNMTYKTIMALVLHHEGFDAKSPITVSFDW